MMLLLGGTTEGREAATLLDELKLDYIYSTRGEVSQRVKGTMVHGGMDIETMSCFCKEHHVTLILDAAHPFAALLHHTAAAVAKQNSISVLRYQRVPGDEVIHPLIRYVADYDILCQTLLNEAPEPILALSGVQTINRLQPVWKRKSCYFRILNSEKSWHIAQQSGIAMERIIRQTPTGDEKALEQLISVTGARCMVTKASGINGFFNQKVAVALRKNIPLYVLQQPSLPHGMEVLNNYAELKKRITTITTPPLRGGYSTGACVTAAAQAALLAYTKQKNIHHTTITLPDGERVTFAIVKCCYDAHTASCTVIKDGGDDPDATHGHEIGCSISLRNDGLVQFHRGKGVGVVTLPGLALAVGEPAINPVPRKMIEQALRNVAEEMRLIVGWNITPFVPEGDAIALKTFNPRIGIVGGISIIGTTGRVKPYSSDAYIATIQQNIAVAVANRQQHIVLNSGGRSERYTRACYPHLGELAFVHYGNFIGEALKACIQQGVKQITLAIMLGKAVKLAAGHLDTHSKKITLQRDFLQQIASHNGYPPPITAFIKNINMANEITASIPFVAEEPFYQTIKKYCISTCNTVLHEQIPFSLLLMNQEGMII